MYKCHLTGLVLDQETAYILDLKNAIELSKALLEKYNELKKIIDEYGKVESFKKIRFGTAVTIRRNKYFCKIIAEMYNSTFSNNELFIPLKDHLEKQQNQIATLDMFHKKKKRKRK